MIGIKETIVMKKYFFAVGMVLFIVLFFAGCFRPNVTPANVTNYVEAVSDDWNLLFSNSLELISWDYVGIIEDYDDLKETLELLTDPDSVRLFQIDITDPSFAAIILLSSIPSADQNDFAEAVEELVELGQHKVRMNWKIIPSGSEFTTIALVDEDNIVWDSIIGSVVVKEEEFFPVAGEKSGSVTIKWLWGTERGKISWSLECSGPPLACSYTSEAKIASGEARIETKLVKGEDCCTLHYAWAYRTPTGSISIDWNPDTEQFDVEVSSWGSTGSGQGVFECCL